MIKLFSEKCIGFYFLELFLWVIFTVIFVYILVLFIHQANLSDCECLLCIVHHIVSYIIISYFIT